MRYFWILALVCHMVAAEPGIFYNPPTGGKIHDYSKNPVYTLGQTVQMRWTTTLDTFSIMLWQNNNADYEWVQTDISDMTSYDWIVSTNRNLSAGNVFFFQVRNASDIENLDELFASHYFNITENSSTTTTSSSTTSTQTTATTSVHLSVSASATATTSATHPPLSTTKASETNGDDTGHDGLSTTAKIGVGVGAGVGFISVFVGILIFCLHRRRPKSTNTEKSRVSGDQSNPSPDPVSGASQSNSAQFYGNQPPIFEAPMNEKSNLFEAPAYNHTRVHEAPLNEKKQLYELQ